MGINVGSATATLNIDLSKFEKGLNAASVQYKAFIDNSDRLVGFNGSAAALSQLRGMIEDVAKLEDYSTSEKIAAYEKVQKLYENNATQQMALALKVHGLKKQLLDEEFATEMSRVTKLSTGNARTTDFAAMIAEYERLKERYGQDAEKYAEIDKEITEAAADRKNKLLGTKVEEVDGLLKENERFFQANRPLHGDDKGFEAEFYKKQIAAGRTLIDELESQGKELTKEQAAELAKRLDAEKSYYANIERLSNESAAEIAKAQEALTEATVKAEEKRAAAAKEHAERTEQARQQSKERELVAAEDSERGMTAVNSRMFESEQRLNEAYERTFESRRKQIANFSGIFDDVSGKEASGEQLLANLQGQMDAMKSWQEGLDSLKQRGVGDALYAQLAEMGAGKYAEIAALGKLSDEQLRQYEALFEQKNTMARNEAYAQLANERQKLQADIMAVKAEANAQLDALKDAYGTKMQQIQFETERELEMLRTSWIKTNEEIDEEFEKQSAKQIATIELNSMYKRDVFKSEAKEQGRFEAEKTQNTRRELARQEVEVRMSSGRNVEAFRDSVPAWEAVGVEIANALLRGIISTEDDINNYFAAIYAQLNDDGGRDWGGVSVYAKGTPSAVQGLAVVGEAGPEIVDFSGGEQVLSFRNSMNLLMDGVSNLAGSINAVNNTGLAQEAMGSNATIDYERLAKVIAEALPKVSPSINYSPTYNSPKQASVSELMREDKLNLRRLGLKI